MTEWNGAAFLLTVDQLIDALTEQAADPSAPFVLDDGEFSLAASITAAEQAQWFHDVNPGVRDVRRRVVHRGRVRDRPPRQPLPDRRRPGGDRGRRRVHRRRVIRSPPASRASPRSAEVTPAGKSSAAQPGSNASRRALARRGAAGGLRRDDRSRRAVAAQQRPRLHRRAGQWRSTAPRRRATHAGSRRRPADGRRPGPGEQLARGDRRRRCRAGGHHRPRRRDGRRRWTTRPSAPTR